MVMFGVPEAKRIKRSELLAADNSSHASQNSSRQVSPSHPDDQVEVDYGFEYDFISPPEDTQQRGNLTTTPISDIGPGEKHHEDSQEATFQFRLFARPNNNSSALPSASGGQHVHQAIRLSSTPEPAALTDEVSLENAHFIRPRRPDSYHFTPALPESKQSLLKSQFADVALSTFDVLLNASTTKWPGAAVPWRVINVTLANQPKKVVRPTSISRPAFNARPRPRPSKKRRILLRRQLAAKSEVAQRQKLSDEAEKEKRTRRNREKKVKRKEREKQKKKAGDAESNPIVSVSSTTTAIAGP